VANFSATHSRCGRLRGGPGGRRLRFLARRSWRQRLFHGPVSTRSSFHTNVVCDSASPNHLFRIIRTQSIYFAASASCLVSLSLDLTAHDRSIIERRPSNKTNSCGPAFHERANFAYLLEYYGCSLIPNSQATPLNPSDSASSEFLRQTTPYICLFAIRNDGP
jgi:hypothetical protein